MDENPRRACRQLPWHRQLLLFLFLFHLGFRSFGSPSRMECYPLIASIRTLGRTLRVIVPIVDTRTRASRWDWSS
ncbi:uncharacterized protein B0H64DRAFT_401596 [Chaetomium fimeti]|uniref:Secreted protein n=1 Tax=Chaetomium fimeti TaxID=1854472 RepID=A0AAE0HEA5_9PEZI|nr:hypothetical protein B0H64DRAFT_401596 [Chaetomium fimeti]